MKKYTIFLDTSNEDVLSPPEQLPDNAKAELIRIASWLLDNGRDEYLTVYGKIRGGVLQRSLNTLRNHQRSVSGGSTHGSATGTITTGSPMMVINNHTYSFIYLFLFFSDQNFLIALKLLDVHQHVDYSTSLRKRRIECYYVLRKL